MIYSLKRVQEDFGAELDRQVKKFEERFGHVEDGPPMAYFTRNDQRCMYVTLTVGGVKDQGASVLGSLSPEDAIRGWYMSALAYASERGGGSLYWRKRPEFVIPEDFIVFRRGFPGESPAGECSMIQVYSRVYVSVSEEAA